MKFHVTVGKKTNVSTNKDPSLLNSLGRIAKFVSKPSLHRHLMTFPHEGKNSQKKHKTILNKLIIESDEI